MKHTLRITLLLVFLFVAAQVFGLLVISQGTRVVATPEGVPDVVYEETVAGPRPEVSGADSFLLVIVSVLIGTVLLLGLIRLGKLQVWKVLFFWAVFMAISIALGVFLDPAIAFSAGFILAVLKLWRPHIVVHNLTEVLMYAGIAFLFAPLFQLEWIILLLLAISAYDMFAVWKSGHMVTMAKALTAHQVFAGLSISYSRKRTARKARAAPQGEVQEAILGGGDIAFPLLFSGVVMEFLITSMGAAKEIAFLKTLIVTLFVTLALVYLLVKGEQGKFYPAMPFLTAGAFFGLGIILVI